MLPTQRTLRCLSRRPRTDSCDAGWFRLYAAQIAPRPSGSTLPSARRRRLAKGGRVESRGFIAFHAFRWISNDRPRAAALTLLGELQDKEQPYRLVLTEMRLTGFVS